jgi:hypothetical protein
MPETHTVYSTVQMQQNYYIYQFIKPPENGNQLQIAFRITASAAAAAEAAALENALARSGM